MERDYWYTTARDFAGLEAPESVGRIGGAARFAAAGRGKVETQKVPVIFEPRTARTLLGNLFDAVNGCAIYRQRVVSGGQTGREDRVGERSRMIDDGTMPGLFGSSPFDDEGRAHAAHGGDREGRAEKLPAEHAIRRASWA